MTFSILIGGLAVIYFVITWVIIVSMHEQIERLAADVAFLRAINSDDEDEAEPATCCQGGEKPLVQKAPAAPKA